MKRTCSISIVLWLAISIWPGRANPARDQTALERLEQKIRARVEQPPDANPPNKPANDARQQPKPPVPDVAAQKSAPEAGKEPGYLGLMADDKDDRGRGVRVLDLRPGGPAEKAGLKKQDLITGVAGVRVRQMEDMADVLGLFSTGQSLTIDVLRDGKSQTIKVTLGRPPQPIKPPPAVPEQVPPDPTEGPPELPLEPLPAEDGQVGPKLPELPGPEPIVNPNAAKIEALERRIEQLERRVAALEKALAEALKSR